MMLNKVFESVNLAFVGQGCPDFHCPSSRLRNLRSSPVPNSLEGCRGTQSLSPVIGLAHSSWFAPDRTKKHPAFFNSFTN